METSRTRGKDNIIDYDYLEHLQLAYPFEMPHCVLGARSPRVHRSRSRGSSLRTCAGDPPPGAAKEERARPAPVHWVHRSDEEAHQHERAGAPREEERARSRARCHRSSMSTKSSSTRTCWRTCPTGAPVPPRVHRSRCRRGHQLERAWRKAGGEEERRLACPFTTARRCRRGSSSLNVLEELAQAERPSAFVHHGSSMSTRSSSTRTCCRPAAKRPRPVHHGFTADVDEEAQPAAGGRLAQAKEVERCCRGSRFKTCPSRTSPPEAREHRLGWNTALTKSVTPPELHFV